MRDLINTESEYTIICTFLLLVISDSYFPLDFKHNKQTVFLIIFRCKYPKCTIHIHMCMHKEWTNMLQNLCYNCNSFSLHKSIHFMEHKYDIMWCDDLLSQQNSVWQTSLQYLRVSITILNTVRKKVCLVYISLPNTDKHVWSSWDSAWNTYRNRVTVSNWTLTLTEVIRK